MKKIKITRTVWIISIVSLLTNVASEMLYPVMPIYLKSIGFSALEKPTPSSSKERTNPPLQGGESLNIVRRKDDFFK